MNGEKNPSRRSGWASELADITGAKDAADLGAVLTREDFWPAEDESYDDQCRRAYAQLQGLRDAGYSAAKLMGDRPRMLELVEACAVVNPSLSMVVATHYFLSLGTVAEFGACRGDIGRLIEDLDDAGGALTFVITEIGFGNSHTDLKTVASYDRAARQLVVDTPHPSAQKFMAANGLPGVPKTGIVMTRLVSGETDFGIFPVIVPLRDEDGVRAGVRIQALPQSRYSPMDYSVISFDRVRVPVENLLSDGAVFDRDGVFRDSAAGTRERQERSLSARENAWIAFASQLAAVGRAGVSIAFRHSQRRMTHAVGEDSTPRPVIEHRLQQHALLGALATIYATTLQVRRAQRAWLDIAAGSSDASGEWSTTQFNRTLGVVRAVAARDVERALATCSWRSGAQGIFNRNRIPGFQGLAHILNPAAGDGQLVALRAARALGDGADYEPPTAAHRPEPAAIDEPELWQWLARTRERRLHRAYRSALAERVGLDAHAIANETFLLGQQLVDAHVHRLRMEEWLSIVTRHSNDLLVGALRDLAVLYAVEASADQLGWYLTEGLLTSDDVRGVNNLVNALCERLTPQITALLDAFAIPDEWLDAPMANGDYLGLLPSVIR